MDIYKEQKDIILNSYQKRMIIDLNKKGFEIIKIDIGDVYLLCRSMTVREYIHYVTGISSDNQLARCLFIGDPQDFFDLKDGLHQTIVDNVYHNMTHPLDGKIHDSIVEKGKISTEIGNGLSLLANVVSEIGSILDLPAKDALIYQSAATFMEYIIKSKPHINKNPNSEYEEETVSFTSAK